jgi:hypothetical protein
MANDDPGAKPYVAGFVVGFCTVVGGPVGFLLSATAGAAAYLLGRAIGRSRNAKTEPKVNYDNLPSFNLDADWCKLSQFGNSDTSLSEFTFPKKHTNPLQVPVDEIERIKKLFPIQPSYNSTYEHINRIADLHQNDEEMRRVPIQRQTRREASIDEYGQIWE